MAVPADKNGSVAHRGCTKLGCLARGDGVYKRAREVTDMTCVWCQRSTIESIITVCSTTWPGKFRHDRQNTPNSTVRRKRAGDMEIWRRAK